MEKGLVGSLADESLLLEDVVLGVGKVVVSGVVEIVLVCGRSMCRSMR